MLEHYLKKSPLNQQVEYELHQIGAAIQNNPSQEDLNQAEVAILVWRMDGYSQVQEQLYQLSSNFTSKQVIDLGEIKEDEVVLLELYDLLLEHHIFPILLTSESTALALQMQAFNKKKATLSIGLIDSQVPYSFSHKDLLLNKIFEYKNQLTNLTCIGYQNYLTDEAILSLLEDYHFEHHRLGTIQSNLELTEPIIRDIDLAAIDIRSIRCTDAPARRDSNPNGFFAAEACQIVRYLTLSDQLCSLSLQGVNLSLDHRNQTATLIAQLVWFAINGYMGRLNEYPIDTQQLAAYLVDNTTINGTLTFFKSGKSDRWWMQVPAVINEKQHLVACSYQDYQAACRGELSDRLLNALNRL